MENDSKTERSLVVSGSLQRHQVAKYLKVAGVTFEGWEDFYGKEFTFEFEATDEQWDRIQAWVKKVTG